MAVSFGYDTDTNAAITGSIAGAMYGQDQIPERWLNQIKKKGYLDAIYPAQPFLCAAEDEGWHLQNSLFPINSINDICRPVSWY